MPKFSVISPVYNTAAYLDKFIQSVMDQTFPDWELILVDDGSSDNSLEICRSAAAKDSRVVALTQKNQGSGFARNKGIEAATGEYLLFFDSDDWVDEKALEVLSELLKTKTDLLIFGAHEVSVDADGEAHVTMGRIPKPVTLRTEQECRAAFGELIFNSILNPPWNKVYSRALVEQHHIRFADTRRAQDAFFNMDYFCHVQELRAVDNVLYYYREIVQANVWKKYPKEMYQIDIRYNERVRELLIRFGSYDGDNRTKADAWFLNSVARAASLYRNPRWKLSSREKYDYVHEIISHPYNRERAETAWATTNKTQAVKKRILEQDVKGMMRDIRAEARHTALYDFYCRTLRRVIKKG